MFTQITRALSLPVRRADGPRRHSGATGEQEESVMGSFRSRGQDGAVEASEVVSSTSGCLSAACRYP